MPVLHNSFKEYERHSTTAPMKKISTRVFIHLYLHLDTSVMIFLELLAFLSSKNGVVVADIFSINKKYKIMSYYHPIHLNRLDEVFSKEYVEFQIRSHKMTKLLLKNT